MAISQKAPQLVIVMGVSGCGKSTIADIIANKLGYLLMDADDFHTDEAKVRMAQQLPLTDEHRKPWIKDMLTFINKQINDTSNVEGIVLAYSGLKKEHRAQFNDLDISNHFIFLHGQQSVIESRMLKRHGHFFPASLLQTQFDALELPECDETNITELDITLSPDDICQQVFELFNRESKGIQ